MDSTMTPTEIAAALRQVHDVTRAIISDHAHMRSMLGEKRLGHHVEQIMANEADARQSASQLPALIAAVEAWGKVDAESLRQLIQKHCFVTGINGEAISYKIDASKVAQMLALRTPPNIDLLVEEIDDLAFPTECTSWTAHAGWGEMRKRAIALIRKWAEGGKV